VRVVFDSNVLIAGLIFPGRQAEKAIARIIDGDDRLIVSKRIVDKVLGVLARKFGRDREELARIAVLLVEIGELVMPNETLRVQNDDADNRILECALAGDAEAIVSGDRELLALGIFEGIPLLSLRSYLEMK